MLRSILSRLPFVGTSDGEAGGEDRPESEEDSEGGFRPSRLDASVLSAHGADVERVEEMADIEQQAQELEEAREEWK
jgi:endo-1,4-beta-mannosidase